MRNFLWATSSSYRTRLHCVVVGYISDRTLCDVKWRVLIAPNIMYCDFLVHIRSGGTAVLFVSSGQKWRFLGVRSVLQSQSVSVEFTSEH
eukprot:scaffold10098_cov96-Cylindrotheca_fusiformis.AAC.5